MPNRKYLFVLAVIALATTANAQQSLDAMIDRDLASLVATYKNLHATPELSHHEEKTAAVSLPPNSDRWVTPLQKKSASMKTPPGPVTESLPF